MLFPANGFAMPTTERPQENLDAIRQELAKATCELNNLKMGRKESLYDFEYRVKRHSDRILSLNMPKKTYKKVSEALGKRLSKCPIKMGQVRIGYKSRSRPPSKG